MIVRSFIAAAAALTLAGTATAAEPKPPVPAAAPTAGAGAGVATSGDKRYCIVETLTGSRVPTKVCKTKREWRAQGVDLPSTN
jgi:hypothetical protein